MRGSEDKKNRLLYLSALVSCIMIIPLLVIQLSLIFDYLRRAPLLPWCGGSHDLGFIAEEVGAVLPEIVSFEENGIDAIGVDSGDAPFGGSG